jgi:hypothetical protein
VRRSLVSRLDDLAVRSEDADAEDVQDFQQRRARPRGRRRGEQIFDPSCAEGAVARGDPAGIGGTHTTWSSA